MCLRGHEDTLQQLADTLQERNVDGVSILATMGKYRTGKSFFLNLMVRRLVALEKEFKGGDIEFMGSTHIYGNLG